MIARNNKIIIYLCRDAKNKTFLAKKKERKQ